MRGARAAGPLPIYEFKPGYWLDTAGAACCDSGLSRQEERPR